MASFHLLAKPSAREEVVPIERSVASKEIAQLLGIASCDAIFRVQNRIVTSNAELPPTVPTHGILRFP